MQKFNKFIINLICAFIPFKNVRRKIKESALRSGFIKPKIKISPNTTKYLSGLNGIEIGGSSQNSYNLENTGAYCNVDFEVKQGGEWQLSYYPPKVVNIVASGDDLPFKDDVFDYVFNSHVIEHFFDPIKAIKEWMRVIKKGGLVYMIVPNKEKTFDKNRSVTSVEELLDRHNGKIKVADYVYKQGIEISGNGKELSGDLDPECQVLSKVCPQEYSVYEQDDHHHWSVWDLKTFLELCKALDLNVIGTEEIDDKIGVGFTVIIKK